MKKLLYINIIAFISLLTITTLFSPYVIHYFASLFPSKLILIANSPTDGLTALFIVSMAITLFFYIPFLIISSYIWLQNALYKNEKKIIKNNVLLSIGLFIVGSIFGFFSYMNFGVPFFIWINNILGIQNYWNIYSLISSTIMAALFVGISFLFPIILNMFMNLGILKVETLKKNRVLAALLIAAIIVIVPFLPNNPIEQLVLFIPLYGLFECTIFFNRRKQININIIGGTNGA